MEFTGKLQHQGDVVVAEIKSIPQGAGSRVLGGSKARAFPAA